MNTKVQKNQSKSEKVLKIILNTVLIVNTLFVIVCADNPNVTVFIYPMCVYLVVGFLRINLKQFHQFLTSY